MDKTRLDLTATDSVKLSAFSGDCKADCVFSDHWVDDRGPIP